MFIIRLIIFVYIMMCMSLYITIYVCTYIGVDHVCGCICTLVCIVNLFYYDNVFLIIEVKKNVLFQFGQNSVEMGNRSSQEEPTSTNTNTSSSSRLRGRSDGGEGGEEHEELEVEVPPPMRPISSMPTTDADALKVLDLQILIRTFFGSCKGI